MSPAPRTTTSPRRRRGSDLLLLAVPDHRGAQRQAGLERGHRRLGAGLLHEAQQRAHGDDGEDDAGLDPIADGDADDAGGDEDQDERAGELADQDGQRPAAALAPGRWGRPGGVVAAASAEVRPADAVGSVAESRMAGADGGSLAPMFGRISAGRFEGPC
jgi:hypothetical protein